MSQTKKNQHTQTHKERSSTMRAVFVLLCWCAPQVLALVPHVPRSLSRRPFRYRHHHQQQHPKELVPTLVLESSVSSIDPRALLDDASSSITTSSTTVTAPETTAAAAADITTTADDATFLATALGYVLGFASILLYTPIAFRVYRQKHADGLTLSTWWLKLSSYTCSDIYYFTKGYPLSTYVEILTITIEAFVILGLVAFYQKKLNEQFWLGISVFVLLSIYGLTLVPPNVLALGQVVAAVLNSAALIPQFLLNYQYKTKGDYSPLTAGLAASGCAIRLYTITQLADSDPVLLGSFGLALVLNASLFGQIVFYGMAIEGLTLKQVFAADLGNNKKKKKDFGAIDNDEEEDVALLSEVEESQVLIELSKQ